MKRMIRSVLKKIFYKIVSPEEIISELNERKIKKLGKLCKVGNDSIFYEQANVINRRDPENISIGKNTHIRGVLKVLKYGGNIEIGNNCYIGENSQIWSGESIKIGNNVLISHNVNIIDTNSHEINYVERKETFINMIKYGQSSNKGNILTDSIIIENDVWINFNCIITKGVKIGRGAIIAAGTIVTKDVPEFCVFGGEVGKVLKMVKQ